MGFKREFALAREWVAAKLDFTRDCGLSVFESTIRVMGGLLAAFDMTPQNTTTGVSSARGDLSTIMRITAPMKPETSATPMPIMDYAMDESGHVF